MFGDCHKLDGVVAEIFDPRQNVFGEIPVRSDPRILHRDSHMGFVYPKGLEGEVGKEGGGVI